MAYPGTFVAGQVLTAAEMNAINEGASARPLLTDGAYIDGTNGLVMSGLSGNYASTPDSAALDITGDIEIVVRAASADWTPTVNRAIVAKRTTADGLVWQIVQGSGGAISWSMRTGGTDYFNNYTAVPTPLVDGTMYWLRVTRTAATGVVTMEYAADSATEPAVWTTLSPTGTAVPGNLDTNNAEVQFGAERGFTIFDGTISRVIIRDGIGGTVALDADFEAEAADTLAFTEDSTNAATVSVTTTRYTVGLPGVAWGSMATAGASLNTDRFIPFLVTESIDVDMFVFEVTTAPVSAATLYLGLYAADDNYQPTGDLIVQSDVPVGAGVTGVFYNQFGAPVTLKPGAYVIGLNTDVAMILRANYISNRTQLAHTLGSGPFTNSLTRPRTAASFPTTPLPWNNRFLTSVNLSANIFLRWKAS